MNNRFIEAVGFPQEDETILISYFIPGNEPLNGSIQQPSTNLTSNYWLNPVYRTESDQEYPLLW